MTISHSANPHETDAGDQDTNERVGKGSRLWFSFLRRRILGAVVNLVLLTVVTFFIVRLIPGDPATAIAGDNATAEQVELVRQQLGLDKPLFSQLLTYLANATHLDFGTSFRYGVSAIQIVLTAAPYTLAIAGVAVLIVLIVGISGGVTVGILTRGNRRRWLDRSFNAVTSLLQATPPYLSAILLVLIFAVWLAVLPAAFTLAYNPVLCAILPILALAIGGTCSVARIVRRETAVTQEMDFMRTARGWRLPSLRLNAKHLMPNLLTTSLTLSGIIMTSMLGSSLIVEAVFAWPGLGSTVIKAIAVDKDYPVIQASVFFIGSISILITMVIDIVLGIVDPRTLGSENE